MAAICKEPQALSLKMEIINDEEIKALLNDVTTTYEAFMKAVERLNEAKIKYVIG